MSLNSWNHGFYSFGQKNGWFSIKDISWRLRLFASGNALSSNRSGIKRIWIMPQSFHYNKFFLEMLLNSWLFHGFQWRTYFAWHLGLFASGSGLNSINSNQAEIDRIQITNSFGHKWYSMADISCLAFSHPPGIKRTNWIMPQSFLI